MSCRVLSSAWPIWSEPVTFGGGMTIVNGSASSRAGRNRLLSSQWGYQRDSMAPGSKVLGSSLMRGALDEGGGRGEEWPGHQVPNQSPAGLSLSKPSLSLREIQKRRREAFDKLRP